MYINGLLQDTVSGYDVSITNSSFRDNNADNDGAGILAVIITKLYIDNCEFINNDNRHYGSVSVQYFQSYDPMNVQINSKFDHNTVQNDDVIAGGAISAQRYDYGDDVYPLNCYDENQGGFDENIQSLTLFIDSCRFTNNDESAIGLRIVSAYITNSYFYNNTNSKSHGGAIQSLWSWFEVTESQFIQNSAELTENINRNMDIHRLQIQVTLPTTQGQLCRIPVQHSNFTDNSAELGGAIFIGSSVTLEKNEFTHNNGEYGGAVALSAYNMSIFENQFANNNATAHGGCVFQTEYSNDAMTNVGMNGNDVSMVMKHNTFNNCKSYIGGAVFLKPVSNQEIIIEENQFLNSYANDVGGGLVISISTNLRTSMTDLQISLNQHSQVIRQTCMILHHIQSKCIFYQNRMIYMKYHQELRPPQRWEHGISLIKIFKFYRHGLEHTRGEF